MNLIFVGLILLLSIISVHFLGIKREYSFPFFRLFIPFMLVFGILVFVESSMEVMVLATAAFLGVLLLTYHQEKMEFAEIEAIKNQALFNIYHTLKPDAPIDFFAGWAASSELASTYIKEILRKKPSIIVEAGSGVSTIVAGYVLKRFSIPGKVVSLDHDEKYAEFTREQVKMHGLEEFCEVVHAPITTFTISGKTHKWYDVSKFDFQKNSVDVLLVDGPIEKLQKSARYPAYPIMKEFMAENAYIIVDDAKRMDEQNMVSEWMKEMNNATKMNVASEKGIICIYT